MHQWTVQLQAWIYWNRLLRYILELKLYSMSILTTHVIIFIDSCSSRILRCVQCQANTAGEIFCTVCESGHELIDNECKRR